VTNQNTPPAGDVLDALVTQLLGCSAALSQIIAHMCEAKASGLSSPEAAPIPEAAHSVIRSVVEDLPKRHSDEALRTSADIVHEVATAICEEVFFVPPAEIRRRLNGSSSQRSPRRRPRSKRRHR
jgi:hypothetical protein